MLRVTERNCVVVGGGKVGVRKVLGLLNAGAHVTVISPELDPTLEELATEGTIEIRKQTYTTEVLTILKPVLVFAATNESSTNQQIVNDAKQLGALVDTVTESEKSDFINMAAVRRGAITIGISSEGLSPALIAHLQKRIEAAIGYEYAILAVWMGEARPLIQNTLSSQRERAQFWQMILDSDILSFLRQGDESKARTLFNEFVSRAGRDKS